MDSSNEEVEKAMRKFPTTESPHPNGFTVEFCKDLKFFTNSPEDRK